MEVTMARLDVFEFEVPRLEINDARRSAGGRLTGGLLRLGNADGAEGHAHIGDRGGNGARRIREFWDEFGGHLIGCRPDRAREYWRVLDDLGHTDGTMHAKWAPVDVALWDLAGKAAGAPVHQLLGTRRTTGEVYATYPPLNSTVEGYVEEATRVAGAGLRAYKIHPGAMAPADVVEMVGAVRRAVGDEMQLMLDPNHGYDVETALTIGRALDVHGFRWFEDPVPWSDQSAIERLSGELSTPLAMSDSGEFLEPEARLSLERGWPAIVRGSARKIGISGLKAQCDMAAEYGRQCEIGTAGNSLMNAANVNVMMAVENCWYHEYWMPLEAQQFGMAPEIRVNAEGLLEAPTEPGLGYEVDEEFVARHRVETLVAEG